jgi:WD40 repeat protein
MEPMGITTFITYKGELKVWDARTARELLNLSDHNVPIETCGFSPDGRAVVYADPPRIMVRDAVSGSVLRTLVADAGWVKCVVWSADGARFAYADKDSVTLCDSATVLPLRTFRGHAATVLCCDLSSDGRLLVTGSEDKTVRLWDVATGDEVAVFSGHGESVTWCCFSPDGRLILSASYDGEMILWDPDGIPPPPDYHRHEGSVVSCAFSPDGSQVASLAAWNEKFGGYYLGTSEIKLWETRSGTVLHTASLADQLARSTVLGFSHTGEQVLVPVCDEGRNLDTIQLCDALTSKRVGPKVPMSESLGDLAMTPDQAWMFVSAQFRDYGRSSRLSVWHLVQNREAVVFDMLSYDPPEERPWITACAISPDGSRVLTGWSRDARVERGELILWDAVSGSPACLLGLHGSRISACRFSHDGSLAVAGIGDGTMKIIDAADGTLLHTLYVNGCVADGAVAATGACVAAGLSDGRIVVWERASGRLLCTHELRAGVQCLASSPVGEWMAAGDEDGHFYIFSLENFACSRGRVGDQVRPSGERANLQFDPRRVAYELRRQHVDTVMTWLKHDCPKDALVGLGEEMHVAGELEGKRWLGEALCRDILELRGRSKWATLASLYRYHSKVAIARGDLFALQACLLGKARIEVGDDYPKPLRLRELTVLLDEHEALCRRLEYPAGLRDALGIRAAAFARDGQYGEALALLGQLAELCRKASDRGHLLQALNHQAIIQLCRGKRRIAERVYREIRTHLGDDVDRGVEFNEEASEPPRCDQGGVDDGPDRLLAAVSRCGMAYFLRKKLTGFLGVCRTGLWVAYEAECRRTRSNEWLADALLGSTLFFAATGEWETATKFAEEGHGLAQETGRTDLQTLAGEVRALVSDRKSAIHAASLMKYWQRL